MPWNYPHYQVARFVAPNFMAGNTVILKHAPQCPKTAEAIADILKDAGLPEGVYNNVFATNEQAATIIEDSRVQGVSLTGSERAGQAVAKIAGGALKKVVLELGGSDAFIVAADADIEQAIKGAILVVLAIQDKRVMLPNALSSSNLFMINSLKGLLMP